MKKLFGIIGWSGSGKTDLICRLISAYKKQKIIIGSIKHSHHNFEIDKKGKDSFNHILSGSEEVIIYNEKKYALISNRLSKQIEFNEVIKKFSKNIDLILVEGLKGLSIDKIEVYRTKLDKSLLFKNDKNVKAIVCDKPNKDIIESGLPIFEFSQTEKIQNFISKKVNI